MKSFIKILTFLIYTSYFLFFIFNAAFALEQEYPKFPGTEFPTEGKEALPKLIVYFFNFAMAAGGITALTVITIGGFRWMLSAAAPGQKKEAMDQIKAGLFGLLILLGSYLILQTINPNLLKLQMPALK